MTCTLCKKKNVCSIVKSFETVRDNVYPWWEGTSEDVWMFAYKHCTQFELKNHGSTSTVIGGEKE